MHIWSLVSAFILSFWVSRGIARLPFPLRGVPFIVAVHLVAGGLLYAFVGLLKSYFLTFAFGEAKVVLISQALWLALDLAFTGSRRLAGEEESSSAR
ncbi:MAG: hypothetical protein KGL44_00760 [Sphingomonadales bacterium]|nr:hypothetical protein [Sphingomonadales bacterium]